MEGLYLSIVGSAAAIAYATALALWAKRRPLVVPAAREFTADSVKGKG